jgi:O-antigen/teichoic acid export membrane protein
LICTISQIQADIPLFLLLSTSILFKAIGVEWFYNGVEEFKYITVRSIIIRILSLIALFMFVREKDDLFIYAAISVFGTVGNNVFNFFRLRKYVDTSSFGFKDLQIWRHFNPALKIFTLNLIISLYVNLDSIMLGFMKDDNDVSVGYYTASTRISKTLVGLVTSLGTVLLPRLSHLAGNNKMEEFISLSNKSINFIIAFSLPLAIGVLFMASPIIHLFCGSNFEPSILTLQIMAPIIVLIPLSGIYSMQILYALGKEKLSILAVSSGAVANFTLNLLLIPGYSQYGAGIATVIAECLVTFFAILLGRKYISFRVFSRDKVHYYIASLLIIIGLYLLRLAGMSEILYLITGTTGAVIVYLAYLMIVKDEALIRAKTMIMNKINPR